MADCNIFEIWEQYKNALHSYIRIRVADQNDAQDILQDVLLKSYGFCAKGKTVVHLKSWLYKITQHTIIDYYKHSSHNSQLGIDFEETNKNNGTSIIGEASDYIKELLKLLPQEYATPLFMYDIEGTEQKIIAQRLNLTLSNTKSRIQRARIKLKERFLECCLVEFDKNGEMSSFDIKPHCKELQAVKQRLAENIS
jgi:RNA polymerase sigma-70 factor (ECF subfamily)